jgi:predicted outer membrane repeat protein
MTGASGLGLDVDFSAPRGAGTSFINAATTTFTSDNKLYVNRVDSNKIAGASTTIMSAEYNNGVVFSTNNILSSDANGYRFIWSGNPGDYTGWLIYGILPWNTFVDLYQNAVAGDTIYLAEDITAVQNVDDNPFNSSSGNNFTIAGHGGHAYSVDSAGLVNKSFTFNSSSVTIKDLAFKNFAKTTGAGGVMDFNGGSFAVFTGNSVSFTSNSASGGGGAVIIRGNSRADFYGVDALFANNSTVAGNNGGAIQVNASRLSVENSTFTLSGNYAGYGGGIIGMGNSKLDFINSKVNIINNLSTFYGAGMYMYHSAISGASLNFINSSVNFSANMNAGSGAGGLLLYNYHGNFTNSSVDFTNNFSSGSGGGFMVWTSSVDVSGSSVDFYANSAQWGGALFVADYSNVRFFDSSINFASNTSLSGGGAVYNVDSVLAFEASTVTFSNNFADAGGAIYNAAGSTVIFTASNVLFEDNAAASNGGAIYNAGIIDFNAVAGSSVIFAGNSAASGADIYNAASGTININGAGEVIVLGGIAGSGKINNTGNFYLFGNNAGFSGFFKQTAGYTAVGGSYFTGVSSITGGTVEFGNGASFSSGTIGVYGAGLLDISSSGDLTFSGNVTGDGSIIKEAGSGRLTLTEDNGGFIGLFEQFGGTTSVMASGKMFAGTNTIVSSLLEVYSGSDGLYYGVYLGTNGVLNHYAVSEDFANVSGANVKFTASGAHAVFLSSITVPAGAKANYNLTGKIDNGQSNTVEFRDSFVVLQSTDYTGGTTYKFDNSTIDLMSLTPLITTVTIEFSNLWVNNTSLDFGVTFISHTIAESDILKADSSTGTLDLGLVRIRDDQDSGLFIMHEVKVLEGIEFVAGESENVSSSIYEYSVSVSTVDRHYIVFVASSIADEYSLDRQNIKTGLRAYVWSQNNFTYHEGDSLHNMSSGTFYVSGYDNNAQSSVLSGVLVGSTAITGRGTFFNIEPGTDVNFTLEDLTVSSALASGIYSAGSLGIPFTRTDTDGSVLRIMSQNASVLVSNVIFSHNEAYGNGGALFHGAGKLDVVGAAFVNNSAVHGGAVLVQNSSSAYDGSVTFENNKASVKGGAFYADAAFADFSYAGVSFKNNVSTYGGGAVYADAASELLFKNVTFENNSYINGNGGAIYADASSVIFEAGGTVAFKGNGNVSNGAGGAIYAENGSTATFNEAVHFISNTARSGGAIAASDSSLIFNSAAYFTGNGGIDANGGAVYANNDALLEFNSFAEFSDNKASAGGALYLQNASAVFNSTAIFTGNEAVAFGGAGVINDSKLTFNGHVSFIDNKVPFSGSGLGGNAGALGIYGSTATFKAGAEFIGNMSYDGPGGALRITNSKVSFNGGTVNFDGNYSAADGGAIDVAHSVLEFISSTVKFANNSSGGLGGAIYAGAGSSVNISGKTDFQSNGASNKGGAVYLAGDSAANAAVTIKALEDSLVSGNKAGGVSNAFWLEKYADLTFNAAGADITVNDNITSINTNTQITKTGNGVLILNYHSNAINGRLNIYEGTVRTGYATGSGEIYFDAGQLQLTRDVVISNALINKTAASTMTINVDAGVNVEYEGAAGNASLYGTFAKDGAGKLIFNAPSSAKVTNADINAGELRVMTNNFNAALTRVHAGATLSGNGTIIGNLTNYGSVRPGTETQQQALYIVGNYTENGILGIRIDENYTPETDMLVVNGNATVNSGSKIDLDLRHGFQLKTEYKILQSNGLAGIYDGFVNPYSSLNIIIRSDNNNIYLKVDSGRSSYSSIPGLSHNQTSIAKAIDSATESGNADEINGIAKILGTADVLDDEGKKAVLDEISGSFYANALLSLSKNGARKQAYERIERRSQEKYNIWAQVYGSSLLLGKDSNSRDKFSAQSGYIMTGLDSYYDNSDSVIGYMLAFGRHNAKQKDDRGDINDYKAGAYFGVYKEVLTLKGSLFAGYQQYDVNRDLPLLLSKTHAEYDGYAACADINAYFNVYEKAGSVKISPFAAVEASYVRTNGFKEEALLNAASSLTVEDNDFVSADAEAGIRAENEGAIFGWYAQAGAKYNLAGRKGVFDAVINDNAKYNVNIYGYGNSILSLQAEAGIKAKVTENLKVFASGLFEQTMNIDARQISGHVGISYKFGSPRFSQPIASQPLHESAVLVGRDVETVHSVHYYNIENIYVVHYNGKAFKFKDRQSAEDFALKMYSEGGASMVVEEENSGNIALPAKKSYTVTYKGRAFNFKNRSDAQDFIIKANKAGARISATSITEEIEK